MGTLQKTICCLLFLFCTFSLARAETAYVSDQLIITFREGKSTQYKIIRTLKTGTPMEVLERDKDDEYAKVRLQSGEEGYVLVQYITTKIPKQLVIDQLEKEKGKLQKQLAESDAKRAELSQELNDAQEKCADQGRALTEHNKELNQTLDQANEGMRTVTERYNALLAKSEQVVAISNDRDRLQKENKGLASEVQVLRAKNASLVRTGVIKWFLAGGGVFFFGWVIGKISRKRKSRL